MLSNASFAPAPPGPPLGLRTASRHLVIALVVFWAVVAFLNLVLDWPEFVANPLLLTRLASVSTAGGLLSFLLTDLIRRTRDLAPLRRIGALVFAIGLTTLIFSVVNLVFTAQVGTAPTGQGMLARMGHRCLLDVWIFTAWCAVTWRLDLNAGRVARTKRASMHLRLEGAMAPESLPVTAAGSDLLSMRPAVFWRFQVIFWACNLAFTFLASLAMVQDVYNLWRNVVIEISGLAATCMIHYAVLRPTRQLELPVRFVLALGSAMVATCFYIVVMWLMWFEIFPNEYSTGGVSVRGWEGLTAYAPRWFVFNMPAFITWSAMYLAIEAVNRIRRQERQIYDAAVLAQEAQLKMLRFQLNPHFLFNTINAISSLVIDQHAQEAEAMLSRLSDFLRFALKTSPDDRVTLEQEMAAQDFYLGIEKARFDSRLEVVRDMEPGLDRALLPSLILQPVLENSVKYAVSRSRSKVRIDMRVRREGDRLRLDIRDSGGPAPVPPPDGTGVGLNNIRARLDVLYGSDASLEAGPVEGGGYAVCIRLPLEFQEEKTQSLSEGG